VLRLLVEALAVANASQLRTRPDTPWLYASGVRFAEDAPGEEQWTDVAETLERGVGACQVLSAWRLAELRERLGEIAIPRVAFARAGPLVKAHVVVCRADGSVEDPSQALAPR